MDLAAVGVGFGYFFGRIGNFLNQELVGRATDSIFGIYVDGVLRHPSQIYEAFMEGALVFLILYSVRLRKTFDGQLAMGYIVLYGLTRCFCELFRQPDVQLGFLYGGWLTMGMVLSLVISVAGVVGYGALNNKARRNS